MSGGNVIVGCGNNVKGKDIVVIGSGDTITGNEIWAFVSHFSTDKIENGIIFIRNYRIEIGKAELVKTNPFQVITLIDPSVYNAIDQLQAAARFKISQQCVQ